MGLISKLKEMREKGLEERERNNHLKEAREIAFENAYRKERGKAHINAAIAAGHARAREEASEFRSERAKRRSSGIRGRLMTAAENYNRNMKRGPPAWASSTRRSAIRRSGNPALDLFGPSEPARRAPRARVVYVKEVRRKKRRTSREAVSPYQWW